MSGICEERRTGVPAKHSTLSTHPPGQSHPQLQPPQFSGSDMCLQPGPFSPAPDSNGPRGHFPSVPTSDSSHIHRPPVPASALLLAPISGHLQSADTQTLQPRLLLHCPFPSLGPPPPSKPGQLCLLLAPKPALLSILDPFCLYFRSPLFLLPPPWSPDYSLGALLSLSADCLAMTRAFPCHLPCWLLASRREVLPPECDYKKKERDLGFAPRHQTLECCIIK